MLNLSEINTTVVSCSIAKYIVIRSLGSKIYNVKLALHNRISEEISN